MGKTNMGRPKLICLGYSYRHMFRKNLKDWNQIKHWRCTDHKTRCKAKAIMCQDGSLMLKGVHSHPPFEETEYIFKKIF